MVYIVKKNGSALVFYSEDEMKKAGYKSAGKTVSDEEFNSAGCYARVVDGLIVVGKTDAEKLADTKAARLDELKRLLAETDYIAVKIAEGAATVTQYAAKLAERRAWRTEIGQLESA
ncbi:MAG: hypothetical protein LBO04_02455 [Spirochaetaceae bacterium]|jgi:hypothetical protein|nr:hypothetical protein [Spirochaetaceae bacterium]